MKTLEQLQARIDELEAKARQVAAYTHVGCPPEPHYRCDADCLSCWLRWWGLE